MRPVFRAASELDCQWPSPATAANLVRRTHLRARAISQKSVRPPRAATTARPAARACAPATAVVTRGRPAAALHCRALPVRCPSSSVSRAHAARGGAHYAESPSRAASIGIFCACASHRAVQGAPARLTACDCPIANRNRPITPEAAPPAAPATGVARRQ